MSDRTPKSMPQGPIPQGPIPQGPIPQGPIPQGPMPQGPMPEERPHLTPDRTVEAAVRDSFPASDPPATTASQGARAVPPEHMIRGEAHIPPRDAVRVTHAFRDQEAAKLALETLVREVPIDRRAAEIVPEGAGATLAVTLSAAERPRVEAMLRQRAGERDAGP